MAYGGIFIDMSHSTFKRLPSNSDGRFKTSRALRRERVGPQEPRAVECASRVRVVSIHRRYRALSPGTTCLLWRLSHSEKMHRVQIRLGFLLYVSFFSSFFFSLGLRACPNIIENRRRKSKCFRFREYFRRSGVPTESNCENRNPGEK